MGEGCGSWFPLQQFDWQSPKLNTLAAPHPLRQRIFAPASNTFLNERLPHNPHGNGTENIAPKCAKKGFLVFYQSGGQTTVMLSSAFGTPIKCGSLGPKLPFACNLSREDPLAKVSLDLHPGPTFKGVASSTGLTKKQKLLDGSNGYMQFPVDNNSSVNHNRCSEHEYGADSSFGQNPGSDGMDSSSSNKRMRVDKIRETASVLRSLIPGVEGKDAIMVLDEAIDYLKSLKRGAETLGRGTL
ncbi:Detected protein of unknown function [Hibiscus syriacus]|uniref:BHLH domain-containing protein n=1 Tax=Hibiscus syriacus TaxID=106335 RepID=A0A6A2YS51_HIBSY|nr:Detected protein of unknown function [Hibiscus syriacus]